MKYNNKKQKFSVRKLTVGTASVFLGATVVPSLVDLPQELVSIAKASEESATEDSSTDNSVETESSVEKANTDKLSSLIDELAMHASGSPINTEFADSELVARYMSERESSNSILDYAKNILYSGENITSEQVKQLEEQLTTKLNNLKKLESEIEEQNNRTYDIDKSTLSNLLNSINDIRNNLNNYSNYSSRLQNFYNDTNNSLNENEYITNEIINSNKYSEDKVRKQEEVLQEILDNYIKIKKEDELISLINNLEYRSSDYFYIDNTFAEDTTIEKHLKEKEKANSLINDIKEALELSAPSDDSIEESKKLLNDAFNKLIEIEKQIELENNATYDNVDKSNISNILNSIYDIKNNIKHFNYYNHSELQKFYYDIDNKLTSNADLTNEIINSNKYSEAKVKKQETILQEILNDYIKIKKADDLLSLIDTLNSHIYKNDIDLTFVSSSTINSYEAEKENSKNDVDNINNSLHNEKFSYEKLEDFTLTINNRINNIIEIKKQIEEENNTTHDNVDKSNLYNLLEEARKNKNYDYEIFKFASEELQSEYYNINNRFYNIESKTTEILNSNKYSEEKVREQENILREISNDFIKVKEKIYNYVENSELTLYKKAAVEEINNYIDKIDKEIEEIHNITNFTPIEKMVSIDFSSMKSVTNKEEVNKIKKEKIEEINREKNKVLNRKEIENYLASKEELKNIKYVFYSISEIDNIFEEKDKQNIKNAIDNKLSEIINSEKVYEKYNSINRKLGFEDELFYIYITEKENEKPYYSHYTSDRSDIKPNIEDKYLYKPVIYGSPYDSSDKPISPKEYDILEKNNSYKYKKNAEKILNINDFYNNKGNTEIINKIVSELDLYDRRLDAILNLEDRIREDIIAPYNELPQKLKNANSNNTKDIDLMVLSQDLRSNINNILDNIYSTLDTISSNNEYDILKSNVHIKNEILNAQKIIANSLVSYKDKDWDFFDFKKSRTEFDYTVEPDYYEPKLKPEFRTDNIINEYKEKINRLENINEIDKLKNEAIEKITDKKISLTQHRAIFSIDKNTLDIKNNINNLQSLSLIEKQKYKDILDKISEEYKKKIYTSKNTSYYFMIDGIVNRKLHRSYINIIKDYLEKEINKKPNIESKTIDSIKYYNEKLKSANIKLKELNEFIKWNYNTEIEDPDPNISINGYGFAAPSDDEYNEPNFYENSIIKEAIEEKIVLETSKLMLEELPNKDSNSSNSNITTNNSINVKPLLEVDKNNNTNNNNNNITENSNNIDDKVSANNELNSNNTSENNNINVPNTSNNINNNSNSIDNKSNSNNELNSNNNTSIINNNNSDNNSENNINSNVPNNNSNNVLNSASDNISNNNNSGNTSRNNSNIPNTSNNGLNNANDNISNNNNSNNINDNKERNSNNNINQKDKNINSNNSEVPKGINLNNNSSNINSNNNLSTNKDSVSIKNNSTEEIIANNLETNKTTYSININSNKELESKNKNIKLLPNTGLNNTNNNYMAVATILASIYLASRKQKNNK